MTEGSAARLAGAVLARFIAGLIVVALYLLKHDPELLERRMKTREQESEQRTIIALSTFIIIVGLVVPGLDYRFGWSDLPVAVVLAADGVVLLGISYSP